MKKLSVALMVFTLVILTGGCRQAAEQGTVEVETSWGKIVAVHEPGETFTTLSPGADSFEVDLRDHKDGVPCEGVTTDNAPFYMKIDVIHQPIKAKITNYVEAFGAEAAKRDELRWNALSQAVKNACKNATSGKYDAYALRAQQQKILADMLAELKPVFENNMFLLLQSIGMETQPMFLDSKIDEAANRVVAAKKEAEAEIALTAAANERAKRQQIEAQIYANPNAFRIEELKQLLEIEKVRAEGIARHQGTLILGTAGATPQIQIPLGAKQ